MKKLGLLFCVLFACALFNSDLRAEEPYRTIDLGNQVAPEAVFYIDFINSTCIGYPAHMEKITPTNTGRIYFKFTIDAPTIDGKTFYYTLGEKLNNSSSPYKTVAIKGTFKR